MLARFAAKRPPDVFYVDSLDLFDYQPALEPLNGYIQRTRNWSTSPFYARLLNGFSVSGRIYGLPKDWSPLGLIANTQMLQRAGVRAPAAPITWAPAHADDAAAPFDECGTGRRSSVPEPRLGAHSPAHVPERRGVGEPRARHGR